MSMFDRMITGVKNFATRGVRLENSKNDFMLIITEHGHDRRRTLTFNDVNALQEALWDKTSVTNGIVMKFAPNPYEIYQEFEVPAWAMQRLRDDMLNNRIHLNASR